MLRADRGIRAQAVPGFSPRRGDDGSSGRRNPRQLLAWGAVHCRDFGGAQARVGRISVRARLARRTSPCCVPRGSWNRPCCSTGGTTRLAWPQSLACASDRRLRSAASKDMHAPPPVVSAVTTAYLDRGERRSPARPEVSLGRSPGDLAFGARRDRVVGQRGPERPSFLRLIDQRAV